MTDEQAFIAAICSRPDDDTPRLVLADWLDDHNDPDRAAFIRAHVPLAGRRDPEYLTIGPLLGGGDAADYWGGRCTECRRTLPGRCEYHTAWVAAAAAWKAVGPRLAASLPGAMPVAGDEFRVLSGVRERVETHRRAVAPIVYEFARGFPAEIECPAAWWVEHGDALSWHPSEADRRPCPVTACPAVVVRLTDGGPGVDITAFARPEDGFFTIRGDAARRPIPAPDVWSRAGGGRSPLVEQLSLRWPGVRAWHLPPPARGTSQYSHWEREVARHEARTANLLLYGRPEHELRSFLGPPGG